MTPIITVYNWGALVIGLSSLALFWWATSWPATLAVFLMIFANNLGQRRR